MLKKKNIAMVMAAATVATSVAPVFALESQSVEEAALLKEVGEKLAVKYTATPEVSVYKVMVTLEGGSASEITKVAELEKLIEQAKVENKSITVEIMDKGHAKVDGKIVDKVKASATYKDSTGLEAIKTTNPAQNAKVIPATNGIKEIGDSGSVTEVQIKLASGVELVVNADTAKLDFTKGIAEDGTKIDISKIASDDTETAKRVVNFEVLLDDDASNDVNGKIAGRNISKLVCNDVATKKVEYKLNDFITDNGYTQAGKELVELIGASKGDDDEKLPIQVIKDGKKQFVKFSKTNNLALEAVKDGGYKLTVDLIVADSVDKLPTKANVQLVISSNVQKDLADLQTVLSNRKALDAAITVGNYKKLAGDDRFETAIEISKKAYDTNESAKAIVLVGENAVVDGLASAPLAKQAEAPILLTKKDSVPASTMNEIKRAVKNGAVVYLIGGENTISKEVESQLSKVKNLKTLRLAGADRYETSLKIAEELDIDASSNAFVVGGNGLADAMSIAAVAANKVDPIIVTPKDGLTKDASKFLKDTSDITKVDVIGGTNNVSIQVLKDIKEAKNVLANRISGTDRNDTNAKVIAEYFKTEGSLTNVFVAKDADAQLVDALAAAPYAGSTATGAIVLATNDLTKAQEDALKVAKDETASDNKTTQIGNGVASTVMQKVLKALGK